MEQVIGNAKELEDKQKIERDLQTLCESFIKGQGSIYVLGKGNRIQTDEDDEIQDNGPEYVEHVWNDRKVGNGTPSFLNANGGGHRIFPKFQEYAITIAVSSSLLDGVTLSKYQSHDFPPITFKTAANGNIYIVNGHHRIAGWKFIHSELLKQLNEYEAQLKGAFSVASDNDTPEITVARANIDELKERLFTKGGWGAVVLDYGQFNSNIHRIGE